MRPLTDTVPKAMIPFHGKPFLGHILDMLREQGFTDVLLLLGYLPEAFTEHFGDGSEYGLRVTYDVTEPDDLTALRVQHASDLIEERFLLLYCDNYWPMDFGDMWDQYVSRGLSAQITVYANDDGYSRSSVIVKEDGVVQVFDRSRTTPGLEGVEISYAILERDVVLPLLPEEQELFEQAIYPALAERGQLGAYWSGHRYYSVGGHERLSLTEAFLAREPAVILDRDGVLNAKPPKAEYVRAPDEFHWLPGSREALRRFSDAGWRVFVVSNQAGIGRGMMSEADLEAVHDKMLADTAAAGGRIDAVYVCPHDWDEGCSCRKPAPGMLWQAQREHNLDLTRVTFIGDDERDGQTADSAGCASLLVDEDNSLLDYAELLLDPNYGATRDIS